MSIVVEMKSGVVYNFNNAESFEHKEYDNDYFFCITYWSSYRNSQEILEESRVALSCKEIKQIIIKG